MDMGVDCEYESDRETRADGGHELPILLPEKGRLLCEGVVR